MPKVRDLFPQLPHEGPPLPRVLVRPRRIKVYKIPDGTLMGIYGKSWIEAHVEGDVLNITGIVARRERKGVGTDLIRSLLDYTGAKRIYPIAIESREAYSWWDRLEREGKFEFAPNWREEFEEEKE